MSRNTWMLAAVLALGCSGEDGRPGPAPSDAASGGGGTSGTGGAPQDGGKTCIDEHTERGLTKPIKCGGAYCIEGIGCKVDCEGNHECGPGYHCSPVAATMYRCVFD